MTDTLPKKIVAIDLFCGAGGLTRGLLDAGIQVVAGIDNAPVCKYAYEKNNHAHFICDDITNIEGKDLLSFYPKGCIKLLAGCAPCQPFSAYARNVNTENDPRFFLLRQFERLAKEIKPDLITMENVPRLRTKSVFYDFKLSLEQEGYQTSSFVVSCPDYGIPQMRKRLVFFATKQKKCIELLPPTHTEQFATVRDFIGELPPVAAGEISKTDPLHRASNLSPINLLRIQHSKPGGTWKDWDKSIISNCHKKETGRSFRSVYGRMEWDKPSPTITTQCTGFGNGRFGHPEQHRALTLREAALLQTFPKSYTFGIEKNIPFVAVRRMIGNAVPVLLGKLIGQSIVQHIRG